MAKWIYNSRTGAMVPFLGTVPEELELHSGLGWHGPFNSEADAQSYYNANKQKNPGWKAPSTSVSSAIGNAGSAAKDQVGAAAKGAGLGDIDIRSWFIRIGEVLLGIVLVGIGVAKLTGTSNLIAKAAKVAL